MRTHLNSGVGLTALFALLCATSWLASDAAASTRGGTLRHLMLDRPEHHRPQPNSDLATDSEISLATTSASSPSSCDLQQKTSKGGRKVVGYFSDWTTRDLPASAIPFDKLTHINYAFAILEEGTYRPVIQTDWLLKDVVSKAHAKQVKIAISIGGWTGSRLFSPMAADSNSRRAFIQSTLDFVKQYDLDGVDIDWEFPGRVGMACNVVSKEGDADNFYTLLKELREALPSEKYISLAVRVQPFDGPDGPMKDVRRFAEPVDFITVMAYDINGSWSANTGPNAPFKHSPVGGDPLSFTQSASAWTDAGFPKEKVLMGLAFYGRSASVAPEAISASINGEKRSSQTMYMRQAKPVPKGDLDDAPWAEPCPGAAQVMSGIWKWKNLRKDGILSTPSSTAASSSSADSEWRRTWDNETKTPWLLNTKDGRFISYDDPESIKVKTDYVRCQGFGGVMVWALNQDNGELLDAANAAISANESCQ